MQHNGPGDLRFVCVLRSGGDFARRHVHRLSAQLSEHAPAAVGFECLHDHPGFRPRGIGLEHGWPGFFSKIEAFRIPGPALYMDLDVNVTGDLTPLCEAVGRLSRDELLICRDFGSPAQHVVNTSVMGWCGDVSSLYCQFASSPAAHMSVYNDPNRWQEPGRGWGDQGFVRDHWHGRFVFWDDVLPGAVASYKADLLGAGVEMEKLRVLVSHGSPRPWQPGGADEWISTNAG